MKSARGLISSQVSSLLFLVKMNRAAGLSRRFDCCRLATACLEPVVQLTWLVKLLNVELGNEVRFSCWLALRWTKSEAAFRRIGMVLDSGRHKLFMAAERRSLVTI
jgi:hypothetical protein